MDNTDDMFSSSNSEVIDDLKVDDEQIWKAMCSIKCRFHHESPHTGIKTLTLYVTSCEKCNSPSVQWRLFCTSSKGCHNSQL